MVFADQTTQCDIQRGICRITTIDGLTVEFDIDPKPVVAMAELRFMVYLKQTGVKDVSSVALDLSMPGMFMGKNEPLLRRTGGGKYAGTGSIPRCASGGRTWQATIAVRQQDKISRVAFVFEVP